jgi:hypothetical protein
MNTRINEQSLLVFPEELRSYRFRITDFTWAHLVDCNNQARWSVAIERRCCNSGRLVQYGINMYAWRLLLPDEDDNV